MSGLYWVPLKVHVAVGSFASQVCPDSRKLFPFAAVDDAAGSYALFGAWVAHPSHPFAPTARRPLPESISAGYSAFGETSIRIFPKGPGPQLSRKCS